MINKNIRIKPQPITGRDQSIAEIKILTGSVFKAGIKPSGRQENVFFEYTIIGAKGLGPARPGLLMAKLNLKILKTIFS
jgi:hypothetical protein